MANSVANIFGKSPVQPLEHHCDIVYRCASKLRPFFEAAVREDEERMREVRAQIEALECCVMGGPYTFAFWVLFVGIGLLIPLVLEIMEMRGHGTTLALVAAVLVLFGGYTLRHVMMEVGQRSTWTSYETQYNAELLQRLERK